MVVFLEVGLQSGLDPREHSSGEMQRYDHISKQGNARLHYLLVEAAHPLVRRARDEELRDSTFAGEEELGSGHQHRGAQARFAALSNVARNRPTGRTE